MPEYRPMVVKAARLALVYDGLGTWLGTVVSWGITVSAYPYGAIPPTLNGTMVLGANLCKPATARGTTSDGLWTYALGFEPDSTGLTTWDLHHQEFIAAKTASMLASFSPLIGKSFRLRALEIRPLGINPPPEPPGIVRTLPTSVFRPNPPTRYDTSTQELPVLLNYKVKLRSIRRGHMWTPRIHPGPVSGTFESSGGLLNTTYRTQIAGFLTTWMQSLRTAQVTPSPIPQTVALAWPKGWEIGSPIVQVGVGDEYGSMDIRQRHRTTNYTLGSAIT